MQRNHTRGRHAIGFVAIVHTPDSVSFATTAGTRAALIERIAEYVSAEARHRLSASDARQVRTLLDRRLLERAIGLYFKCVGERWDEEWLVTAAIGDGTHVTALALVDEIVPASASIVAVA